MDESGFYIGLIMAGYVQTHQERIAKFCCISSEGTEIVFNNTIKLLTPTHADYAILEV